jgi:oxygen-independent coproporphyrinogen-3 oxidase
LTSGPALGVYIHWPYCARICPYCDFNVRRDRGDGKEKADLASAIIADLRAQALVTESRSLVSIYFGGGTPSLMDPDDVGRMVAVATDLWPAVPKTLEVTLEANPTDVEAGRFRAFAAAGVTRLSLGLQSLDDARLKFLGRNHDREQARRAFEIAAEAFDRLSVDLIYALPGQGPADWMGELREVISLGPEHISAYQLTIEPGTAFFRAAERGALHQPGPEIAADLFETTQETLGQAGFEAYEISNHARSLGARSRHNQIYWRGEDYIGVGPGAHGRLTIAGERWECVAPRDIAAYIAQASIDTSANRRALSAMEAATERLILGLRTCEGVRLAELEALNIPPSRIEALAMAELVELSAHRITVRPKGRLVLDRLVLDLAMAREGSAA